MDPNTPQPLTLVDYYALAIAPTFYARSIEYVSRNPDSTPAILGQAVTAIFEQATLLDRWSLELRNQPKSPREGRSDEGTGDRVA
jgi:hypothetical protein